ncbi:hypothetical protein LTR27_012057 [Elasticomyces elasticus]|nr:hypothetical protein LTR27_012057 [Elasticomyces elasticus]
MSTDEDAAVTTITQNSPLLRLAPELRNAIYELVVAGTTLVSYRQRAVLYTPALGKVCRQIRKEFEGIYKDGAARYADHIEIHVTNINFQDVVSTVGASRHHKYDVGDVPARVQPTVRICVLITNGFEHSLSQPGGLVLHKQWVYVRGHQCELDYEFRTVFDIATLDVGHIKGVMKHESLHQALGVFYELYGMEKN